MAKIRTIECFAGIGACSKALKNIGMDLEILDAIEIDKYAMKSFNAIHGTNFEPQDITLWDKDYKDVDLITHGSPCQDFSLAGKQAGGDINSNTRSSLMYETIRIIGKIRPKYVLWENVKNILSKKHKHNFDNYIKTMESLGYKSYYQVLNSKDYGIPQNRERVFTVSILGNENYEFPSKQELKLKLKDLLEEVVDEKYYLSDKIVNKIKTSNFTQEKKRIQEKDVCDTLLARDYKDPKCVSIGGVKEEIIFKTKNKRIIKLANDTDFSDKESLFMDIYNQNTVNNMCGTLKSGMNHQQGNIIYNNSRIRKLTPKECWRLMGFDDEDFNKAAKVNSNTQLYKQAGNSIVVNVLEKILKNLFK